MHRRARRRITTSAIALLALGGMLVEREAAAQALVPPSSTPRAETSEPAPTPAPLLAPEPLVLPHPREAEPPSHGSKWYGGQILLAGLGAGAIGMISLSGGASDLQGGWIFLGHGLLAVAAPVIHAANGAHWGRTLGSFFLEATEPFAASILGGFIGAANPRKGTEDASNVIAGAVYGYLIGLPVALAVDAFALAWTPERRSITPAATRGYTLRPLASAGPRGMCFGVAGTF